MAETLPAADWTRRADLAALVAALDPAGEGLVRYVGGAVRDTLLGIAVKDIDMATPLEPPAVIERLTAAGIRSVPTGLAHGTVTAITAGGPVEITTLRRDVSTDGRHATVAFSQSWQEDAARRDFTINALYADPRDLVVHDYFGGLADLAARRLRFIGDAEARIREDYLRILRYFRFQARFGSLPADPTAEAACSALAPGLKGLSRERIASELLLLLALPDPAPTVSRMAELGVLAVILPEADSAALPPLIAAERAHALPPEALRRFAALLPADPATAELVGARLRLSLAQRKHIALVAARTMPETDPRPLAYKVGRAAALDRLLITGGNTAPLDGWDIPQFPLKGGMVVARGISAGPDVARILRAVEARWVEQGFDDGAIPALLEAAIGEGSTPA
ncbi:CCA tRNA nucleotidyltransferase [Novosphingobium sp. PASSN1]|uniref:CCA tRNA nucleotidyltransferase n=1 Tax=Novosphingobium sp. PASSN1 TaxID=2015561 RepID=UPI000BCDB895|nr:CCA tRNA nucleotidyltransferase [Novosphingobium sp. PASSN1]OYU34594.1 MAG: polynucleotide adenylyltransferase [Novosphingobium sp. PASSN1]